MKTPQEMLRVLETIAQGYDESAEERQVLRAAGFALLYLHKERCWDMLEDFIERCGQGLSEQEKQTLRQYGMDIE